MKKTLISTLTAGLLCAGVANAAPIYLNFHGTDGNGAYTPVGTTFNNINYGVDSVNPADTFSNVSGLALVDSANAASGYTFDMTVTSGDGGFLNGGALDSVFEDAKPATGFAWYDTSSANLRETGVMAGTGNIVYTFSGFTATDDVTFQFVLGRSGGTTRRIDFGTGGNPTQYLDGAETGSTAYFIDSGTLTGSTSYTFVATRGDTGDSASSFVGAASVNVIPEPGTLVLVGLALGSLLVFRRRIR